jgi:hypothetical protein
MCNALGLEQFRAGHRQTRIKQPQKNTGHRRTQKNRPQKNTEEHRPHKPQRNTEETRTTDKHSHRKPQKNTDLGPGRMFRLPQIFRFDRRKWHGANNAR